LVSGTHSPGTIQCVEMDPSLLSAAAATASAIAAFASLFTSVRLAALTSRSLEVQIEPSISVDFDHKVTSDRERMATVVNASACPLIDLSLRVSIVSAFEESDQGIRPTVSKLVGNHDLQLWLIPGLWRRCFRAGRKVKVDSDSWFTHAREVLSLPNLTATERTARGMVVIDIGCRRAADNRRFNFQYLYVVRKTGGHLIALPCGGLNPADADYKIIVKPVDA
jgi:hypothetical protein